MRAHLMRSNIKLREVQQQLLSAARRDHHRYRPAGPWACVAGSPAPAGVRTGEADEGVRLAGRGPVRSPRRQAGTHGTRWTSTTDSISRTPWASGRGSGPARPRPAPPRPGRARAAPARAGRPPRCAGPPRCRTRACARRAGPTPGRPAGPVTAAVVAAVDAGQRGGAGAAVRGQPGETARGSGCAAGPYAPGSGGATGPRNQISGPPRTSVVRICRTPSSSAVNRRGPRCPVPRPGCGGFLERCCDSVVTCAPGASGETSTVNAGPDRDAGERSPTASPRIRV